jgi:hypothetical protein
MKNAAFIPIVFFVFNLNTTAQNSNQESKVLKKQEQFEIIQNLVNTGQYKFQARKASPQKGPQIDLATTPNYLVVNKGKASADLPYFGRSFSVGYGGDGGIRFDGAMENIDVKRNDKKQKHTIKFRVKGTNDTYSCTLVITGLESATLFVQSNNRGPISYLGAIADVTKAK